MHTTGPSARPSTRGLTAVALAALLVLSACGSSDDDSAASGTDDGSSSAPSDNSDSNTDAPAPDDSDGGSSAGTLTMADGTVYEFELTTCDTSDTLPEALPLSNGYDVFGKTADGSFSLYLGRGGFDDDSAVASGTLEGGFDETGQNASILYNASNDALNLLTVDGGSVSGDLDFSAIGPAGPHGDETAATVDISC